DAEQIKFRKDMLRRCFVRLLENPYDERMIKHLEYVTRIHIDTSTNKSKTNIDLIHINSLLGCVEAVLIGDVSFLIWTVIPSIRRSQRSASFFGSRSTSLSSFIAMMEPSTLRPSRPRRQLWLEATGASFPVC
ncbi:hypothetical protein BGX34_004651, partial [Mortierella sp. NVP85]